MSPATLPIDSALPEILASLESDRSLVLVAPPGAGKTTRIPPALTEQAWAPRRIVVLEPRRIAARAAASRIAQERGWTVGREVGYQIRFERRFQQSTSLVFVTEGVLVQWLQADPFLEQIDCVVFDEVHERNLFTDLSLAMVRRVQSDAREDLRIVAMSATLEAEQLATFLDAPIVCSEGRQHPVAIEYSRRDDPRPLPARVASAVRRLLAEDSREDNAQEHGSILAFLPGVAEIHRTAELLDDQAGGLLRLPVYPLHGSLRRDAQERALRSRQRRIVLATNVAESSVTVEGVSAVVDSGFERIPLFSPATGLDRLELKRISRASANQRSGRAGRLGPGRALRLWTETEQAHLTSHRPAEIHRVDLAGPVLQLHCWGERPEALDWLEPPPPAHLERAELLLNELGALDRGGVTPIGHLLARLPLHPRLGRLTVVAHELGVASEGAELAALLGERDLLHRRSREELEGLAASESDPLDRWRAFRRWRDRRGGRDLHVGTARRIAEAATQIERATRRVLGKAIHDEAADVDQRLLRALLAAYPDRVTRRRRRSDDRGVMVGGRGVRLASGCRVRDSELFVSVDLDDRGRHALVRSASAINAEWLPDSQITTRQTVELDAERGAVVALERTCYRDLVLAERTLGKPNPIAAAAILVEHARADPVAALGLERDEIRSFLSRLACLSEWRPDLDLPAIDDAAIQELLEQAAAGRTRLDELFQAPVLDLLRGRLTWEQQRQLDRLAPERMRLPGGRTATVAYEPGKPPVLAARIQDLFGWQDTPRVAGGTVPLLLHLLAPNFRPQQITDDLAGFWRGTYAEVKKELAGRYPKHSWPDDPATAPPSDRR